MFGRRKREEAAEAAREAGRRALFAKLAERPENICPFLGLAAERTGYVDGVSDEHRCYAFGDPAPLSAEQQTRVCQERGYGNCPRYLRGVLVIPTQELEALRRPHAMPPPPPPPPSRPAVSERRRRGAPLLVVLVLLLAVAAGGGVAYLLLGDRLVGGPTDTPTPSAVVTPSPSAEASVAPTNVPTAAPTVEPTGTPRPTPRPEDVFDHYLVQVDPGDYEVYQVNEAGQVVASQIATFSRVSEAKVDRFEIPGDLHWRTQSGGLAGWSYIYPESGEFRIWAVYLRAEGDFSYELLAEDEL